MTIKHLFAVLLSFGVIEGYGVGGITTQLDSMEICEAFKERLETAQPPTGTIELGHKCFPTMEDAALFYNAYAKLQAQNGIEI